MTNYTRYRFFHGIFAVWCLLLLSGASQYTYAQQDDTLATLIVTRLLQPAPNVLEFDLRLQRDSDEWRKWANGTFQLALPNVSLDGCSLETLPNTSDLDASTYIIADSTLSERISITILGPDEYVDCMPVAKDSSIRLSRFRLTGPSDRVFTPGLAWAQPYDRYQANAFKLNTDSVPWNVAQDNIEMTGRLRFLADSLRIPSFLLKEFTGRYIGDRKVLLCWETITEAYNRGFVLQRGLLPFGESDYSNVEFSEIARYTRNSELRGQGTSFEGRSYCYVDTVPLRDESYVYQLLYENFVGTDITLDTVQVYVPSSVISFAHATPNPFYDQTIIDYILDDRVTLSCKVYDPTGKEVAVLLDHVVLPIGKYNVRFDAPTIASQGLYDVVFIAYPVDDPSVELSTAVVKLQLIR